MRILFLISIFAVNASISARELAETSEPAARTQTLPACINDPQQLKVIRTTLKSQSSNRDKYRIYRETLASSSATELMSRLAYSETLAANCPQLKQKVASRIVQVIANRVRLGRPVISGPFHDTQLRDSNILKVIFQYNQFASSLNAYPGSRLEDFLCPRDPQLWNLIRREVSSTFSSPATDLDGETVNYFLYQHNPAWKKEPWSYPEDPAGQRDGIRSCLRLFKVKGWRQP